MPTDEFIELVELAVTIGCLLMAVACIVGCAYIIWIYRNRHEDAPFLTRLVLRDIRVTAAAAVIFGYIAMSLSGHGLPRPWGALLIGVSVIVMLFGVPEDAITWYRERRRYGRTLQ